MDAHCLGSRIVAVLGGLPDHPVAVAVSRSAIPLTRYIAERTCAEFELLPIGRPRLPGDDVPLGAIDDEGRVCLTAEECHAVTPSLVRYAVDNCKQELRAQRWTGGHAALAWAGRLILLVDDVAATGSAILVAARRARDRQAAQVVALVGVATRSACDRMRPAVDHLVVAELRDKVRDYGALSPVPAEGSSDEREGGESPADHANCKDLSTHRVSPRVLRLGV